MAELVVQRRISIEAETVGDVAKWMQAVEAEDVPSSTPLADPVYLSFEVQTSP